MSIPVPQHHFPSFKSFLLNTTALRSVPPPRPQAPATNQSNTETAGG